MRREHYLSGLIVTLTRLRPIPYKVFDALRVSEVFVKHPHLKAAIGVKSNQSPVLSALSSNSNALLSDL